MEIGVYTFADTSADPATGSGVSAAERIRDLLEEIELADQVGLDVFGIGEHHRPDFAASSPATLLAAAAVRTKQIRLTSAVTVLSSDDPVRVYQDFSTVDLLSNGRAEIMAGRGSFTESFPLFGYDLADYDRLFEDKLDLLLKLRSGGPVTWSGAGRAAMSELAAYPAPVQQPLPVWLAVGGSPNSIVRAAKLGLPLALAIIGGAPSRFVPMVDLYRESWIEAGRDPGEIHIGINSPAYIADGSRQAADEFFAPYADVMTRIGRERGWPPLTRNQYEALGSRRGALVIGNPDDVVEKILYERELFGNDRFLAQIGMGSLPHANTMRAIELLGTVVAPKVRAATAQTSPVQQPLLNTH